MGRGSHIARVLRRQQKWRGNGRPEIEPQQPEQQYTAHDLRWLAANDRPPPRPNGHCLNAAQQSRTP